MSKPYEPEFKKILHIFTQSQAEYYADYKKDVMFQRHQYSICVNQFCEECKRIQKPNLIMVQGIVLICGISGRWAIG